MKWITTSLFLLFFVVAKAQSCIGTWVTIDDKTVKKKYKVELYKKDDKLY